MGIKFWPKPASVQYGDIILLAMAVQGEPLVELTTEPLLDGSGKNGYFLVAYDDDGCPHKSLISPNADWYEAVAIFIKTTYWLLGVDRFSQLYRYVRNWEKAISVPYGQNGVCFATMSNGELAVEADSGRHIATRCIEDLDIFLVKEGKYLGDCEDRPEVKTINF